MIKSETLGLLFKALANAQSEIKGALKDSSNPFYKSKYATLESVWDACREPLSKNGLSVIQLPRTLDGKPALETILGHSSGEWISEVVEINPTKNDPQGMGSAISYFRRYSLAAVVGIYQEDDDANIASNKPKDTIEKKQITKNISLGITEKEKNLIQTLVIQLNWDSDTVINRFKMTTGKETSNEWTREDYEKVLTMLRNVINQNPQLNNKNTDSLTLT